MPNGQNEQHATNLVSAIAIAVLALIGQTNLVLGKLVPLRGPTEPWLLGAGVFGIVGGALLGSRLQTQSVWLMILCTLIGLGAVIWINLIVLQDRIFSHYEIALAGLSFVMMASLGFLFAKLVRQP
jgi:hypothetical protein